jgi:hypothetical protein
MSHPGFDGDLEARIVSWQKGMLLTRWLIVVQTDTPPRNFSDGSKVPHIVTYCSIQDFAMADTWLGSDRSYSARTLRKCRSLQVSSRSLHSRRTVPIHRSTIAFAPRSPSQGPSASTRPRRRRRPVWRRAPRAL